MFLVSFLVLIEATAAATVDDDDTDDEQQSNVLRIFLINCVRYRFLRVFDDVLSRVSIRSHRLYLLWTVGWKETCFTTIKFVSLVAVTFGVTWYGYATAAAATTTTTTKEDNNQTKNNILEKHQQHRSYTRNHNDRNYCIMKDYERITSTTTGTELTYHHRKYIVDSVLY